MEKLFEAKGRNGQLVIYPNKVSITRKGFFGVTTQGGKGQKDIYIKNITGIQLKKPNFFSLGYIQIVFSGSSESKGRTFDASNDENSIILTQTHYNNFVIAKNHIEDLMNAPQTNISTKDNSLDDLKKLKELLDQGIITEEEFVAKKKKVLGI